MRYCLDRGYRVCHGSGHTYLGEIYLRMALGEARPPLPVLLKNLGFILRTAPFAAAKARRHLQDALEIYRQLDAPSQVAESLYSLGVLARARKRHDEARAQFDEAGRLARSVEASILADKIDAALGSL